IWHATLRSAATASRTSFTIAILMGQPTPLVWRSNQILHGVDQGFVLKTALGEIIICSGFQSAQSIALTVLVGNNHHRNVFQPGIEFDERYELNTIHSGHVDIADYQVKVAGPHSVPSIHSIGGDFNSVTFILEEFSHNFAHSHGIIHHKNAFTLFCLGGFRHRYLSHS